MTLKNTFKNILLSLAFCSVCSSSFAREKWTPEQAAEWRESQSLNIAGMNFMPANCINQLEMWQAESFSEALKRSDLELGWAQDLGFNAARVFLHDLAWKADPEGFKKRLDQFLEVAAKHNIKVLVVFFDSCWKPDAKLGKQASPTPHRHNSGWLQSPNAEVLTNPDSWGYLQDYVKDVVRSFKSDTRILGWDVYNEPSNPASASAFGGKERKLSFVLKLLPQVFDWVYSQNPSQAVTSGVWEGGKYETVNCIQAVQLDRSEVISFHAYNEVGGVKNVVKSLSRFGRPILCTEYMARTQKSTFDPVLGYFVDSKIGSFCWGFVNGKTQTIYPWDSNTKTYSAPPPLWFHDVLNTDGTPYIKEETDYIKKVLGKTE